MRLFFGGRKGAAGRVRRYPHPVGGGAAGRVILLRWCSNSTNPLRVSINYMGETARDPLPLAGSVRHLPMAAAAGRSPNLIGMERLTGLRSEYRVLGLEEGASFTEVRNAYRRLAKRWHPDAPTGDRERFEQVCAAHRHIVGSYRDPGLGQEVRALTERGRLDMAERERLESRAVFESLTVEEQRALVRRGYSELLHRTLSGETEAEAARALAALNWPPYLVERIVLETPGGASVVGGSRGPETPHCSERERDEGPPKRRRIFSGR